MHISTRHIIISASLLLLGLFLFPVFSLFDTVVNAQEPAKIDNIRKGVFGLNELANLVGLAKCTEDKGVVTCPPIDVRQSALLAIQIVLGFTSIIAFAFVAYGGFLWTTSGGSDERVKKGKETLKWATIGLLILLTAWSLITFVMYFMSQIL